MAAFADRIVAFVGRMETMPLARAWRAVAAAGGVVRRELGRATNTAVVGHRAAADFARWQPQLDRARTAGVDLLSEFQFLRLLGVRSQPAATAGFAYGQKDIQAASGLATQQLSWLVLFDIVEPVEERFDFRDLILAKSIARLLADGMPMADLLRALAGRRACFERLPAHLVEDDAGRIVISAGEARLELDGQLRLPLAGGGCDSSEQLLDAAEAAEEDGDLVLAQDCYRRCLARDRSDAIAAFNLANVLHRQGRLREARLWLEHAVASRPGFADAWYNLGVMMQTSQRDAAADCFMRALRCDPSLAEALYNLAAIRFEQGRLDDAADLWRRYLQQDPQGQWARMARHGCALCRLALRGVGALPEAGDRPADGQPAQESTAAHPVAEPPDGGRR